jgi:hypothetical protein
MLTAIEEVEKMVGIKPSVPPDEPRVPTPAENEAALAELSNMMKGVRR